MEVSRNYYAIIPASVRYDSTLPSTAKLLYAEITALSNDKGYCWASNAYFAELYHITTRSVGSLLSKLKKNGHVHIEIIDYSTRHIYLPLSVLGTQANATYTQDRKNWADTTKK